MADTLVIAQYVFIICGYEHMQMTEIKCCGHETGHCDSHTVKKSISRELHSENGLGIYHWLIT